MGPAEVCYAVFMSAVRIIQFTDPHLYGGEGESLRGVATLPALTAAMAHAHAHAWPPHALLVTGDLVQDDPSGYPHFRRLFGALGLPVLCLPGNHDEPEAMRRELDGAPFVLGGFADFGRWRIVLLDSCLPGSASGALSAQALAGLEKALSSAGARHCLVCLHHHPVPMGSRWLDRVGLTNAAEFVSPTRSEEHTSELQSPDHLVCRLLLAKKKQGHGAASTAVNLPSSAPSSPVGLALGAISGAL